MDTGESKARKNIIRELFLELDKCILKFMEKSARTNTKEFPEKMPKDSKMTPSDSKYMIHLY